MIHIIYSGNSFHDCFKICTELFNLFKQIFLTDLNKVLIYIY